MATALFAFISAWNEFFLGLVLLKTSEKKTLPVVLTHFIGAEGVADLGPLAAAAFLATLPSLVGPPGPRRLDAAHRHGSPQDPALHTAKSGWASGTALATHLRSAPAQSVRGYLEWKDKVATPAFQEYYSGIGLDELRRRLVKDGNLVLARYQR